MIAPDITLEESTHTYTDTQGIIYTPVSTVLGRYKEPFDRMAIATKTAKRQGLTVEEVLSDWDSSAPHGTAVHRQIEGIFRGVDYGDSLIQPHLKTFHQWRATGATFHPESILCHRGLRIAGTADLLVEKPNGVWSIVDWKTNKAIYKNSFGGKMMKAPLDHLEDCNWIHYSLQLSFYAVMLERPIEKLSLVHLPKGKESLEIIPCLDLRGEVEVILDEWSMRN